jgi:hypothetical protein
VIPLSELVRLGGEHARTVLIGLQKPLMPSWLYVDAQNGFHIVGTPWRNEAEKKMAGLHMRKVMQEAKAVAYSVVTEAWASHLDKSWKPGQPYTEPRLDPKRQEIVLAFATDGEATEWKRWAVIRDWNDTVVKLEEQQPMDSENMTSWMNKLLPKRKK